MKKFSIASLARIIKAEPIQNIDGFLTGVNTDSRTIKAGDCFFAIAGENSDGHNYISEVLAKGAACAVVNKNARSGNFASKIILKVDDTIKSLGDFAREYRRQMNFKVVAITGSVGKTTTRQIIFHSLSQQHHCHQAPKNFNNNIGLPIALLGADLEHKIIIVELGSNSPGEIAYLTGIAQPNIAVVTNVKAAHLEGFGNLQTILNEKLSIAEGLQPDGLLIVNADSNNLGTACRAKCDRFITFGQSDRCNIQAKDIVYKGFSSNFTLENHQIDLPLPGPGNIENMLAAWAVCKQFGMTIDEFAMAVKNLSPVSMRSELLKIGTLTVLNDCYNANPASMKNALQILANLGSAESRRLVFICGDMAELGSQSEKLHAELGPLMAQANVKLLLTVGNFAKIAARHAKTNDGINLQIKCFKNTVSVCNNLKKFIKDYDIILVKGSRAAKLETVVERLKQSFNT